MHKKMKIKLESNHPGFTDKNYVKQRNQIAQKAIEFQENFKVNQDIQKIPIINYTNEQHKLWNFLISKISKKIKKFAAKEIHQSLENFDVPKDKIPTFQEINSKLAKIGSKFKVLPTLGLLSLEDFNSGLSRDIHLSTQYIRHTKQPEFTPEPDIIHDLIGHLPSLIIPKMRMTVKLFGQKASKLKDKDLEKLSRLFWFTFEYGICKEGNQIKAYGAGNLSSISDLERCIDPKQVKHKKFDIQEILETPYNPQKPNQVLFVAESIDHAMDQITNFLNQI